MRHEQKQRISTFKNNFLGTMKLKKGNFWTLKFVLDNKIKKEKASLISPLESRVNNLLETKDKKKISKDLKNLMIFL